MRKIATIISLFFSLASFGQGVVVNPYILGASVPSNGLASANIAYYKLDEASGTIVDSKNAFNSTTVTGVTYNVTGKLNTAVTVANSAGNGINCGNHATLNITTGSISIWFQYVTGSFLVSTINSSTDRNGFAIVKFGGSQFGLQLANGTGIGQANTTGTFTANTWYHLVATWDGSQINFYINGVLDSGSPVAQTVAPVYATNPLILGSSWNGTSMIFPIGGTLDEVGIFNSVLTQTQVTTLYNSGTPLPFTSFN